MRTSTVIRIIIVLLIILVASALLTVFLQKRENNKSADTDISAKTTDPAQTKDPADTDGDDPAHTGEGPDNTEPVDTGSPVDTKEPTDPKSSDTTKKDDPTPVDPADAPDGFTKSGKFVTDNNEKMIGIMSYKAVAKDGKVLLTVTYDMQYYPALMVGVRKKDCYIKMNDNVTSFTVDRISDEGDIEGEKVKKPQRIMTLFSATATFDYGETVHLEANYPIGLKDYAGSEVPTLHAVGDIILK